MSERRITVSLDPYRWRGSPVIVWVLAGEAWLFVGLLIFVALVGGQS